VAPLADTLAGPTEAVHVAQPAITAVNRQIRAEALLIYFADNIYFCTNNSRDLQHSSDSLSTNSNHLVDLRKLLAFGFSHFHKDSTTVHSKVLSFAFHRNSCQRRRGEIMKACGKWCVRPSLAQAKTQYAEVQKARMDALMVDLLKGQDGGSLTNDECNRCLSCCARSLTDVVSTSRVRTCNESDIIMGGHPCIDQGGGFSTFIAYICILSW